MLNLRYRELGEAPQLTEPLPSFPQLAGAAGDPLAVRDHGLSEDAHYVRLAYGTRRKDSDLLFWVHGGSIATGSAGWPVYDPQSLADELECIVVSINYPLGLLSRRFAGGELVLDKECFAVESIEDAIDFVAAFLQGQGVTPNRVLIGGHSVGAVMALGIAEKRRDQFHGVIAASPILEAFRGQERIEIFKRRLTAIGDRLDGAPANLRLQQQLMEDWGGGEFGAEVLGLFRPQFGARQYPWEAPDWRLGLPLFSTWSEGEYSDYGLDLKGRLSRLAVGAGDIIHSIEVREEFGLDARQLHRAAIPVFFGNSEAWQGSSLVPFLQSKDFGVQRSSLMNGLRDWWPR